jgi:hypothetical protein
MREFSQQGKLLLSGIVHHVLMARNTHRLRAGAGGRAPDNGRPSGPPRRRSSAGVHARRRLVLLVSVGLAAAACVYVASSGGGPGAPPARAALATSTPARAPAARTRTTRAARTGRAPSAPHVVVTAPAALTASWTTVAQVHGRPAAWMAQRSGVTLLRLDQSLVHLTLHAGSIDGGVTGWTYGDQITPREIHLVVAAFNGGFKLTYSGVGFVSGGHVAVALKPGLASIVTYTDGTSNIGGWLNGVPTKRKTVFSVLQNEQLLVDRGVAAPTVTNCVIACWGATIQALTSVARTGIGITQSGQLLWAASEQLTPAGLAAALVSAGAVRAIELDINPHWVAGYLYVHRASGPVPVPIVPGQQGILGQLLTPYSRDFLAVVAN